MTRVVFITLSLLAHGGIAVAVMSQQAPSPPKKTEPKLTFVEVKPPETPPDPVIDVPVTPAPKAPTPKRKQESVAPTPDAPPPAANQPPSPPVLGISFASTVTTGSGPSLAVGSASGGKRVATAPQPMPEVAGSGDGVNVVRPARTAQVEPPYPADLRAQGIEADVTVRVKVGADGNVLDASVVKAAQEPAFNASALATARRERFTPGTRDGVPVPFVITFTYRFRIET